jgi:thiol-disulfide isomerase/thioredoxin
MAFHIHRLGRPRAEELPIGRELSSLAAAQAWLNSEPLGAAELRGKVVLVDFWTYTCINWLRTLPYLRAWNHRYRDQGLVVVGVHTPEFSFEADHENVRRAVAELVVDYPVAIDSDYEIWRAFDNHYWPALYLVGADGRIHHRRFGEGEYDKSERALQQLLAEAGRDVIDETLTPPESNDREQAADWQSLRTPESYLGYGRAESYASPERPVFEEPQRYTVPSRLGLNEWALSAGWTIEREDVVSQEPNAGIAFRFHARDLHLVMGPGERGAPGRFRVRIDGEPPLGSKGHDVDEQGNGTLVESRLYQLIRQPMPITDRLFEIEFLDPGAKAYVFTFG